MDPVDKGVIEDISGSMIGPRAARGAALLVARTAGIRVTGLVANIILSRLLSPRAFGLYAITLFLLVLLSFISDFGLGGALLQRKERLSQAGLRSVFAAQLVLAAALFALFALLAGPIGSAYHLGPGGEWYVRAMALAGVFSALKSVPKIMLERQLLFGKVAAVEVVENGLFQVSAVALAVLGLGAWSFIGAVVVAQLASMLLSFGLAGWRPGLAWDRVELAQLWRFGLPFQLSWFTYLFRDYLIPILGGLLISTTEVGYLNWALALAGVPGQLAQVVGRISFPSFARLQDDPARLRRAIEESVRGLCLVAAPIQLVMVSLAPWLIHIVFTDKWLPALVPFYLLSIHWAGASFTSPLVSALNATGRTALALKLSATWTAATLAMALLLIHPLGYIGIALAFPLTMVGAATAVVIMVSMHAHVSLWRNVRYPLGCAVAACGGCFLLRQFLPVTLLNLVLLLVLTGVVYVALVWAGEGPRIRTLATTILSGRTH